MWIAREGFKEEKRKDKKWDKLNSLKEAGYSWLTQCNNDRKSKE